MANILTSSLLLKFSFIVWLLEKSNSQVIVKEPLSLLIPANEIGVFSSKAICDGFQCSGFWVINGIHRNMVDEDRMRSHYARAPNSNEYTLTLTVNASEAMNNTRIQCKYEALTGNRNDISRSATVYLFVISSSPILSNPTISKNVTHLTLMWSPPFLWPGHRLQHYNVFMTNKSNGSIFIAYYRVDTSITNLFVTALFPMSWSLIMLSCTRIAFSISPIDGSVSQTFNVSDWAWTFSPGSELAVSVISVSVLFRAYGAPALVEVYVQLPTANCSFNELNYSLIIENTRGNLMAEVDTFPTPDSHEIKESIKLDLKENQEYSLKLRVTAQSQIATSQKHTFNTHLLNNSSCRICNSPTEITLVKNADLALPYKMLTGVFGALTLVLLLAFLVIVVCLCTHHRERVTEIKLNESKNRVCNVMVHNPIYDGDGPVYESVQTQFELNNETEIQSEDTRNQQYDNLRLTHLNMCIHLFTCSIYQQVC